jgi:hypothetical protein
MKPITFCCQALLPQSPEAIAQQILDLANWPGFTGYGFIPGIKQAEFAARTPSIIGSQIRVTNWDGSSHIEEIVEWEPTRRLRMKMQHFSPPLSRLAAYFEETWEFEITANGTSVRRSFRMHPKSPLSRLPLWLISHFLKRAVARHLRQMHQE